MDAEALVHAGLTITATHWWPGATGKRAYLGDEHMHDFRIRVTVGVEHDERQVEFHDLRDALQACVDLLISKQTSSQRLPEGNFRRVWTFGPMSCESIARHILEDLPYTVRSVEVFEDEYCGATVTRQPVSFDMTPPRGTHAHNIVTLCGSTRFKDETLKAAHRLKAEGWVVEMVEFFSQADGITLSDDAKERVDRIHKDKIKSSDAIYVVNPGGYIGGSTKSEIEYAESLGKRIMWMVTPSSHLESTSSGRFA
jgi:6-pyruvoyl-tetrahydropterin synthase